MKKTFRRKRVTIDPQIQGGLCLRVCLYWILCLVVSGLFLLGKPILEGSLDPANLWSDVWNVYARPLLGTLLVLPLVLLDVLVFSNRFAGPLYRFRKELRSINEGDTARRITLRPGDFAHDVADEVNKLIDKSNPTKSKESVESTGEGAQSDVAIAT